MYPAKHFNKETTSLWLLLVVDARDIDVAVRLKCIHVNDRIVALNVNKDKRWGGRAAGGGSQPISHLVG